MPDKTRTDPKTGVTTTYHITSGQQKLMSKMKWKQTVRNYRAKKKAEAKPPTRCERCGRDGIIDNEAGMYLCQGCKYTLKTKEEQK